MSIYNYLKNLENKNKSNMKNKIQTFKKRVWISLLIMLVVAIYLFLVAIVDVRSNELNVISFTNTWFDVPINIKKIFVIIIFLINILAIFQSSKEISNLIRPKNYTDNKIYFGIFFLIMLIFFAIPSIFLIYWIYFNQNKIDNVFYIAYAVILIIDIFIFLLFVKLFIKKFQLKQNLHLKQFFSFSLINLLFFISLFYLSVLSSWAVILFLFVIVSLNDALCYIFGTFLGVHKIKWIKKISKNKTIEGYVGGSIVCFLLTLSLFIAANYLFSFQQYQNSILTDFLNAPNLKDQSGWLNYSVFWWIIVVGIFLIMIILASLGDLLYSYIKRVYAIKDFGKMLGPHGGILDRIDSLSLIFITGLLINFISNLIFALN